MFALMLLLAAVPGSAPSASPVLGGLRIPQVAVYGTALQDRFLAWGESIDVGSDQFDAELLKLGVQNSPTFTFQVELSTASPQRVVGLYDGHAAVPSNMPIFPGNASGGWFAVISFRPNPARVIVNAFDNNAVLVSSTTYPGGNRNSIGFYIQGPDGTFFSQDARNPGGSPQALYYCGTGFNTGQLWLAFEERSLQEGSDQDFADAVLYLEIVSGYLVPVETTTWGRLKARFR